MNFDLPEEMVALQDAVADFATRRLTDDAEAYEKSGEFGFELPRRLRAEPRTSEVVIVAVTAYAMKGDEERARAAGCDDYVTKPIDTRALPGMVAEHLARGRKTPP